MKIGDRVFVNGYVDEIRKDTVIIRNKGGYFGTAPSEVIETINELPSAEAVHKPDYSYEADMVRRLKESLSAEAEDRHYIKIYADDEPSVKAEKLYQICGETQNREVAEWLKEYFPSAEAKDDSISRQWLLDLYATPKNSDDVEWKVPLEVVRQNIIDAPSAEPKTKCIAQIRIDQDDMEDLVNEKVNEIVDKMAEPKTGECSGCKFIGSYDMDFPCVNCVRKTKDYYCGARMVGEEE